MRKSTSGFTLVELIVSIAVGAIVMGAALSFLLMGMRMQGRSYETASQQNSIRIVMALVENLAKEGEITALHSDNDGWYITGDDPAIYLLQYDASDKTISIRGTEVMSGLEGSTATLNGRLLTITITTKYGTYETSVYCRVNQISTLANEEAANGVSLLMFHAPAPVSPDDGRDAFLSILDGQQGSGGEIIGAEDGEPQYFSEWYIKQQYEVTPFGKGKKWNENTPWCACFISWAAAQLDGDYLNTVPYFANVDEGATELKTTGRWKNHSELPTSGDLIFFNLDADPEPDHVGVVLSVDTANNIVCTIEGNSDEYNVKCREYPLDSADILGYGVLDWKVSPN